MKKPMPPPDEAQLMERVFGDDDQHQLILRALLLYSNVGITDQPYLPWDELRYKQPPPDLTTEQWWLTLKFARRAMQRKLSLHDVQGAPFIYALPDEVLQQTDYIASYAKGQLSLTEEVTNPATRDRYLVSQLIEEAITSSQLEGASTSGKVAREMLRSGREARDKSEQMILNNFRAMQRIGEVRDEPLTIELICEIHRIVTENTLDNPDAAGRFQTTDDDRVAVWDNEGELLHRPPPAEMLSERMQHLCDFANGGLSSSYLPGVLRSLTLHFMIGYEHPFEDGNGRTARALFYWSMLNQGYWLTEFLSVSRILKKAPSKYARSFLHTETDSNDLTYFFSYHLGVLHRAIDELHGYLRSKANEIREVRKTLRQAAARFNARQLALLQHALKHPTFMYTVQSHKTSHRISTETARSDLVDLEVLDLLRKRKIGKRFVFESTADLSEKIKSLAEP